MAKITLNNNSSSVVAIQKWILSSETDIRSSHDNEYPEIQIHMAYFQTKPLLHQGIRGIHPFHFDEPKTKCLPAISQLTVHLKSLLDKFQVETIK